MTDEERTIDYYDRKTGWSRVPDPFTADGDEDEVKRAAGFPFFTNLGGGNFSVQVWTGPEREYALFLEGFEQRHDILAADFPSLVELLEKLTPIVTASELTYFREIASDLKELLTNREGPLAEAAAFRRNIERLKVERDRAAKLKRETTPTAKSEIA